MYSVREISDCVRGPSGAHSSSPQSQPPSQEHPVGYTDTCLWYPHQGSKQNLVWERSTEGRGSEGGRASFLSVIISLHLRGHMSQCFSCVSVTPFPVILSHCSRCHWILPRPPLPGRCTQSLATGSICCPQLTAASFLKESSSADASHLTNDWQVTPLPCSQWQRSIGLKRSSLVSGWIPLWWCLSYSIAPCGIRLGTGFSGTPLFSYSVPLTSLQNSSPSINHWTRILSASVSRESH